jgi:hypothetical protein
VVPSVNDSIGRFFPYSAFLGPPMATTTHGTSTARWLPTGFRDEAHTRAPWLCRKDMRKSHTPQHPPALFLLLVSVTHSFRTCCHDLFKVALKVALSALCIVQFLARTR